MPFGKRASTELSRDNNGDDLAPCWYCAAALFGSLTSATVIVGESVNFQGGIDWLRENGVKVFDMNSKNVSSCFASTFPENPETWNEDIGE